MFDKKMFAIRLKELRSNQKITAVALAEKAGVSKQAISQFEKESNYPHVNTLTALADYFEVSLDYLVGRTDCPDILTYDKDGNIMILETMKPSKGE